LPTVATDTELPIGARRNVEQSIIMCPLVSPDDYEIEFRWKEAVIYWEGSRGVAFPGGWGVDPLVTLVPDSVTWDRKVPAWLRGRHDEVVARLRW
jgi:hypothetical protein